MQAEWASADERAACGRSLRTQRECAVDRCFGTPRRKIALLEKEEVQTRLGRLLQQLEKLKGERRKQKEAVVQLERSRAVPKVVGGAVVTWRLRLRSEDCLKAWNQIAQKKGPVEYAFLASILR